MSSTPIEEHDYIGLSETPSMEKISDKTLPSSSSSSSPSSSLSGEDKTSKNNTTTTNNSNKSNTASLNFKETELRLGLPGSRSPERPSTKPTLNSATVSLFGKDIESNKTNNGFSLSPLKTLVTGAKRGFSDAIDGSNGNWVLTMNGKSEVDASKGSVLFSPRGGLENSKSANNQQSCVSKEVGGVMPPSPKPVQDEKKNQLPDANEHSTAPAAKAQVVGWPPIRSFRKNTMASNLAKSSDEGDRKSGGGSGCLYVKVSMDGAPYLRKVDLKTYNNYLEFSSALEKMFSCFTIGQCGSHGLPGREGLSDIRLMDLLHGSEYVLTYEDKDGDWMLVGDVPWEMFTDTCRRLRIMKGSEAIGLAPRAMEKCKNRN